MSNSERYLPIDEEGYFVFDGRRVDDEALGRKMLENLEAAPGDRVQTSIDGEKAWVESFDSPLVVKHVSRPVGNMVQMDLPYNTRGRFTLDTLSIDEWDRFHGLTEAKIPFVFSRTAQMEFFDFLDEFDDESITVDGKRYATPPWIPPAPNISQSDFWTEIYKTEPNPHFDLKRENPVLSAVMPQLKMNKGRVLVLGCGPGHDAAYFARAGHMVTAVDFTEEAVRQTKANYSSLENLKVVQADAFNLPKEYTARFDLVFEHTCYCAVSPDRRNELVKVWKRVLVPNGDVLGIFFVNEKRTGPPFGGSEWEVRERLKGSFDFMFWTRWRLSEESRRAKELVVFARRKALGKS